MAGIYLHIPFCKQACNYCDFHFSTIRKDQSKMVDAICKELFLRKKELKDEVIETIYFGGGTPTLLNKIEWSQLFSTIQSNYTLAETLEITVEANPDDLDADYLDFLYVMGVNRLSIGVQSFFDEHLQWMNRAHKADQAVNCVKAAQAAGITNISIDLIYGIPNMTLAQWESNINTLLSLKIPHISCYNLTVEPKTKLAHQIKKGEVASISDEQSTLEYELLCKLLSEHGYIHYEISNFALPNYFSQHNTSYWKGINYIGIGPSAHSYNQVERSWNCANNATYIEQIHVHTLPKTVELLTSKDLFNEHLLIGLRTIWGCDLDFLKSYCNLRDFQILVNRTQKMVTEGFLYFENNRFFTTPKGKNFADKLSSDLFLTT